MSVAFEHVSNMPRHLFLLNQALYAIIFIALKEVAIRNARKLEWSNHFRRGLMVIEQHQYQKTCHLCQQHAYEA